MAGSFKKKTKKPKKRLRAKSAEPEEGELMGAVKCLSLFEKADAVHYVCSRMKRRRIKKVYRFPLVALGRGGGWAWVL